jgi:succinate-acetate transporter protein
VPNKKTVANESSVFESNISFYLCLWCVYVEMLEVNDIVVNSLALQLLVLFWYLCVTLRNVETEIYFIELLNPENFTKKDTKINWYSFQP